MSVSDDERVQRLKRELESESGGVETAQEKRKCAYRECDERFDPTPPTKKYCQPDHRKREHEKRKRDRFVRKVVNEVVSWIENGLEEQVRQAIEEVEE